MFRPRTHLLYSGSSSRSFSHTMCSPEVRSTRTCHHPTSLQGSGFWALGLGVKALASLCGMPQRAGLGSCTRQLGSQAWFEHRRAWHVPHDAWAAASKTTGSEPAQQGYLCGRPRGGGSACQHQLLHQAGGQLTVPQILCQPHLLAARHCAQMCMTMQLGAIIWLSQCCNSQGSAAC